MVLPGVHAGVLVSADQVWDCLLSLCLELQQYMAGLEQLGLEQVARWQVDVSGQPIKERLSGLGCLPTGFL